MAKNIYGPVEMEEINKNTKHYQNYYKLQNLSSQHVHFVLLQLPVVSEEHKHLINQSDCLRPNLQSVF